MFQKPYIPRTVFDSVFEWAEEPQRASPNSLWAEIPGRSFPCTLFSTVVQSQFRKQPAWRPDRGIALPMRFISLVPYLYKYRPMLITLSVYTHRNSLTWGRYIRAAAAAAAAAHHCHVVRSSSLYFSRSCFDVITHSCTRRLLRVQNTYARGRGSRIGAVRAITPAVYRPEAEVQSYPQHVFSTF